MRNILATTFGALLLGAAMLSAQTPAGGQGQPGETPEGAATQPGTDRGTEGHQTIRTGMLQTYTGCLTGSSSSSSGYTLTNIQNGSGATGESASRSSTSSSGATGTSGSSAMSYRVMGG